MKQRYYKNNYILRKKRNFIVRELLPKVTVKKEDYSLFRITAPLTGVALPLMKSVLAPLAKSVSVLWRLTTAAASTGATIQKIFFRSGCHSNFKVH